MERKINVLTAHSDKEAVEISSLSTISAANWMSGKCFSSVAFCQIAGLILIETCINSRHEILKPQPSCLIPLIKKVGVPFTPLLTPPMKSFRILGRYSWLSSACFRPERGKPRLVSLPAQTAKAARADLDFHRFHCAFPEKVVCASKFSTFVSERMYLRQRGNSGIQTSFGRHRALATLESPNKRDRSEGIRNPHTQEE